MGPPRNEACFSQPHWFVRARGDDVNQWFDDGVGSGTGGILMPRPVHLRVGHRYYRFANSMSPRRAQVGGGWWVDYENFTLIRKFAEDNGYGLGDAARLFLSLPYDWTRVDLLVKAILEVPLKAYAGEGRTAEGQGKDDRDRGTKWVPVQHAKAVQYYIPGLIADGARASGGPQLYEAAFPNPEFEHAANPGKPATPRNG